MSCKNLYSTKELESHINKLYSKVASIAKEDGVYEPIGTYFSSIMSADGDYCFTGNDEYHFCSLERGIINKEKTTQNLEEITYWVLEPQVFWLAVQYERQHRMSNRDARRMIFSKELQYLNTIAREYGEIAELEFSNILRENPFQD